MSPVATTETIRSWLAVLAVAGGAVGVVAAVTSPVPDRPERTASPAASVEEPFEPPGSIVDEFFVAEWSRRGVAPAETVDDLTVFRRASLVLLGTVPSLEEIRLFEADARADRLRRQIWAMLDDPRFGDYWAERLARAWVGVEGEPFLVYRRDRFTRWIAGQLAENRPYDELARAVLSTDGLWTSEPAANFVTSAVANDVLDHNELAARTVRSFLGQRIDCAQCHDHPFADWKQSEFQGLAAFFGQSAVSFQGVVDQPRLFENDLEYTVDDADGESSRVVEPSVPFLKECLPTRGARRDRLAAWVTDPQNERFMRATVNRVWGLLFGRPYVEPVDDLPDPGDERTVLLDRLGDKFRESGYDLRRLIEEIVLSRPFRVSSSLPGADADGFRKSESAWAVFPITRLRPEQVIGAMLQAGRLQTIDQNSNLIARFLRFVREQDFVNQYGDPGETELAPQSGTVSQALLRMNGQLTKEVFGANPFSSAGRLGSLTKDDARLIELCFLVTLTRRPTVAERDHFLSFVSGTTDDARRRATEDLLWSLVNSTEFSWNH